LVRLEKRIVYASAAQIALSGQLDGHQAAARCPLDFKLFELSLHGFHFRFEFGGLFYQAKKISHDISCLSEPSAWIARRFAYQA
jgi:hypothetical protein